MKSLISFKSFDLICYGCGNKYEPSKFEPIRNRNHIKPAGGLWTSPIDSKWGWKDWCKAEGFGDVGNLSTYFHVQFTGKVLTINSLKDAVRLPWIEIIKDYLKCPDYETISTVCDAIHLTVEGQNATRFSQPSLYGWDCETVLIMNPACIQMQ